MDDDHTSLQRQLAEVEANLRLIQERIAWYPELAPLDLVKSEREATSRVAALRRRLDVAGAL